MNFILTLLSGTAFPAAPTLAGWLVWTSCLALLVFALFRWRSHQPAWSAREWGTFVFLLILVPLTSLFLGMRLAVSSMPLPGLPADAPGSALMIFSALPWILGAGLLGPWGGAALALCAGLLRGAWDTYSLFTPLEFALLAAWFSSNMRQRYRTPAYELLRQPIAGALLLIPGHLVFTILSALFTQWAADASVSAAARLDLALSNAPAAALAFGGEVLLAGLAAQIVSLAFPVLWHGSRALQPSPGERSLETRFLYSTGTFITLLLLTLLIGDWVVAGRAARDMLADRLSSAASASAQTVPFFLETGQNLSTRIAADPSLLTASGDDLSTLLRSQIQSSPYFDQLILVDASDGSLLAAYPPMNDPRLYAEESAGIQLAAGGVPSQVYSIVPESAGDQPHIAFLAAVADPAQAVRRVLIGRASLETNPLTLPLVRSLDGMTSLGGAGILLDEKDRVLHHSDRSQLLTTYSVRRSDLPALYDDTAADGTRELVYYQPVTGLPWSIVLTVPARQAQQIALNIALPLSLMILFLALVALVSLRVALRFVSGSLQGLAAEANLIAAGNLDHPLDVDGADEVGQLRGAFEQMRASLQARLGEINSLLRVSQEVSSSLEMRDAVKPVLDAILATGARTVTVLLSPAVLPDAPGELPARFAAGPDSGIYAHLDDQVLGLAQGQARIVLPDLARARELLLDPKVPQPRALLAVPLRHENRYYGAVWAAYDQPREFSDSNIRFVTTLAGQAALAVANAHLFLNVETARRQLEAVLNSTPDPVLVTDARGRLLLTNRATASVLGNEVKAGQDAGRVLQSRPLLDLLQTPSPEPLSAEIQQPDGRTFLATASPVLVEGRAVGRVCIMRDVTRFKELDKMKSEFVATVSHDLRSPLTLMRGYATMLEMAGELNEQQVGYVKKIISGVENMTRLVNNLLDLGRIEIGVGLQVENVRLAEIVERVANSLQWQASQKNIALVVEPARGLPESIEADPALLHQAVYNLVENAVKYTPDGGRVTLRAAAQSEALVFTVEDTGIGVSREDLPHLFEKFYRARQREARAQTGSGLGLAIVQSIAASHGGRVWVESVPGQGSAFHLLIPIHPRRGG